jgi:hypothetical protein
MWSTVAVEILERILGFTKSPLAVAAACRACKSWSEVGADAHLWKVKSFKVINRKSNISIRNVDFAAIGACI